MNATFIIAAIVLSIATFFFAFLEAWDIKVGAFEPEYLEKYGLSFLWVSVAALIATLVISIILFKVSQKDAAPAAHEGVN